MAEQFALGSEDTDTLKACLKPAAEMVGSMGLAISQDISEDVRMIDYTFFMANKGGTVKESFEISSVELGILGPDQTLENIVA